jgi:hypothetical protein
MAAAARAASAAGSVVAYLRVGRRRCGRQACRSADRATGPARSRSAPAPRPRPAADSRPRPATGGLLGHVGGIPAEARHSGRQPVLIAQPLPDRRHPHPGLHLGHDVVGMRGDCWPGHLPQPRVSELREPLPDQPSPLLLALGGAARSDPGRYCRGHVLADRLAVHPRLCDIPFSDLPTCRCNRISVTSITSNVLLAIGPRPRGRQPCFISMARSTTLRTPSPWGITPSHGNYVIGL